MSATPPTEIYVTLPVVQFIDREIGHLGEKTTLRADLEAMAVRLNHLEILRRLDELNHAHVQATADKQELLPRQLFEQFTNDNAKWREAVTKSISESVGSNRTLIVVVGFIFTAITILMRFLK
ncbi:MAG TPA: hypothetical protein VN950_22830 [Terriglobales bacterium]|nr:hypothetical protein [Terriglobales bacterium]